MPRPVFQIHNWKTFGGGRAPGVYPREPDATTFYRHVILEKFQKWKVAKVATFQIQIMEM
ncbi:hypothetical protein [Thermoanaerobacterium thermosaccharolyticum]|uniref:hypothetical protein n=1 Tax=Thermoanaerobacterium thermosaccharolyticum TaxID=1517 RepID=UPI002FD98116